MTSLASRLAARAYHQFNVQPISSAILEGSRKEMLYRARQRGLLELDVIVGSFAEKKLPTFTDKQVEEFGEILSVESPDLFKYLSGQLAPSDGLSQNGVFRALLEHVNADHPALNQ